ncbi:lysophospholipid acyltransferase 1 isoform X2 [Melanotaenia boesemani]|uniref:lysophospholipid acyltransferase 1 isoform X2 n=1 Tax=Melanotaenia boesemani TaxID=1250792 RepID=UPI001C0580D3|nr:lysophospholipid acyltransferase 1 isoform X2 [Melanotaenia boesemani]
MNEQNDTTFKTTGIKWLLPVTGYLGLQLEQVNFLACQLFALAAAFWFRLYLSPSHASPLVRHAVATLLGVAFLIFCYGWYSTHILIMVMASYLIIIKCDINNVHRPLMIITQKITILAFQLHDGMCKKSEHLTSEQKLLAINVRPSLIEYLSYNLNFLSVLVGPCSNYKDYTDFIEGRHISRRLRQHTGTCNGQNGYDKTLDISPHNAVGRKLLVCSGCMLFYLVITQSLPIKFNTNADFVSHAPFLTRLTYAFFSIQAARPKFYFAWTLADAVNNAAGYGFQGMDENGKASWDLVSNINIIGIEKATSFKTFIDNWNIQTGIWLKAVCYDRAPKHQLALTFILSALWHGVYPGYYFTFLTAIPITIAARAIRKSVRHFFLDSRALKLGYDILTWAATQLAICYTVMPFLLLSLDDTIVYYRSMYFHVHIISILAAIALSQKHKPREPSATTKSFPPVSSSSSSPCSAQCQPVHSNNNDKLD